MYAATRGNRSEAFGPSVEMPASINNGEPLLTVKISDAALHLHFARLSGGNYRVWRATREAAGGPFGTPQMLREWAFTDFPARDGSARFWSQRVQVIPFPAKYRDFVIALQPMDAAESNAKAIGEGVPTWYEPSSGKLWFVNGANSHEMRWDGAAWSSSISSDWTVEFTSLDSCRMYGRNGTTAVTRSRVFTP